MARHHLDKLAGGGYVEVATGRNGAGAGRPSKRYRASAPEMALELPVRHDDLLVTLLGKALSLLPADAAEAMAEEVGVEYGRAMARSLGDTSDGQRSFRSALHAVADALTAHGFAAHAEKRGDGLRIVSEHCPFGGAAIEHPVICAVDRGLVRGCSAPSTARPTPPPPPAAPWATTAASPPSPADRPVKRHYLDHASTSPARPEAIAAMVGGSASAAGGDPGRIHAEGSRLGWRWRRRASRWPPLLGARSREVVFTSGATEAIASACWGAAERGGHQVLAAVEHSAVRLAAEAHGEVTVVGVDGHGRVDPDELLGAVRDDTALVHLQWGNHEVGTLQPVAEVVAACRERGVLVHVDAAQAAGHVPIAFDDLGADLLSVSAHKLGGPPGVGALLVRRGLRLRPLLVGGDQERARRAGLEPVAAIAGFGAAAAVLANGGVEREAAEQRRLTDRVLDAVPALDGVRVYGDPVDRLPTSSASASTASSPRPCSSASTAPAWPPTPVRRARRRSSSPPRSSRPWASTPTAACACPSAGTPPTTTSTPRSRRSRRSWSSSAHCAEPRRTPLCLPDQDWPVDRAGSRGVARARVGAAEDAEPQCLGWTRPTRSRHLRPLSPPRPRPRAIDQPALANEARGSPALVARHRVEVAEELVQALEMVGGQGRAVDRGNVLGQVVDGAGSGEHDVAAGLVAGEAVGRLRERGGAAVLQQEAERIVLVDVGRVDLTPFDQPGHHPAHTLG